MVALADSLAPRQGYNATRLGNVRLLRTEAVLNDIPVLYKSGAVFVLQGSKQGILDEKTYIYDEQHYLAVSIPVPFRMTSIATPQAPLLAIYIDFDLQLAAELALEVETHKGLAAEPVRSLVSSRIEPQMEDLLLRLLTTLTDPTETAVLGQAILRELHYRVLVGPQGSAMLAALRQRGVAGKIIQSLAFLRDHYATEISVADLASRAGMSIPTYHVHFKELTGNSPMQYLKALRLHEARLMIARQNGTIAEIANKVGYQSPAQFSRDFRRHFGKTAREETQWLRMHVGDMAMLQDDASPRNH